MIDICAFHDDKLEEMNSFYIIEIEDGGSTMNWITSTDIRSIFIYLFYLLFESADIMADNLAWSGIRWSIFTLFIYSCNKSALHSIHVFFYQSILRNSDMSDKK